jgi:glycosyltransferase involved in cell wall biosynthesis
MQSEPLISVVITTYNCEKYIEETLNSAINQLYKNLEIIVVDDGSTDNTKDVISKYQHIDQRISFYIIEHAGRPSVPRNYGIQKAKGEFIAFLDGDDIWIANKIETQIKKLIESPGSVLIYSMSVTFGDVNIFSPFFEVLPLINRSSLTREELIKNGNCIPTSTVIVRTDRIKSIGGFDEDPKLKIEDYDLWIRLGKLGTFCFLPRIKTYYRIHKNQFSGNWEVKQNNLKYLAEKNNFEIPPYNYYRNRGFFLMMIRNIIHLLHYLVAGLGSVYDNIKNNFIKSKIV